MAYVNLKLKVWMISWLYMGINYKDKISNKILRFKILVSYIKGLGMIYEFLI